MEGTYGIWLGKEQVGKAFVERKGLYYEFFCRCHISSEVICRVSLSCGSSHENLGILMPCAEEYTLKKKIPVKQLGVGEPRFWITPKQTQMNEVLVDVYPEEPFRYLSKLQNAYLQKQRGQPRIRIETGMK